MLEMCIITATLTRPEKPADAISELLYFHGGGMPPDPPRKRALHAAHFVLRSPALPVPEQLPYSGYATAVVAAVSASAAGV